jgi:predicted metal-dependent HD superfamily phosphohydrolase
MEYLKVYTFILDKLEKELPPSLSYHNVQHTKDVVNAAQYICELEKISANDRELLLTAAVFHDTGFLKGNENHEASSCDIARDLLPKFNYDQDEVEKICKLILVTKLPQTPDNHLQEILCDADLFYLGSDKYFEGAEQLYKEFKEVNKLKENTDWNKVQIDFLKKHRYFTLTAVKERDKKKKENLQHLLIKQELEKTLKKNRHPMFSYLRDFFLIIIGILIAGFALKGFLVPNHFFDGGVTGISLLLTELYHLNLAYVIVLANLPFIILSYFTVSKHFAIKKLHYRALVLLV